MIQRVSLLKDVELQTYGKSPKGRCIHAGRRPYPGIPASGGAANPGTNKTNAIAFSNDLPLDLDRDEDV